MATKTFDLEIYQGETYTIEVQEFQDEAETIPLPNTGFTGKLQIRASAESDEVLLELTSGAEITIGGADGTSTIRIGADKTYLLVDNAAYDYRETDGGDPTNVRYPISGAVILKRRVTRDA